MSGTYDPFSTEMKSDFAINQELRAEISRLQDEVGFLTTELNLSRERRVKLQNRISHLERTLQAVLDKGMPK